MKQGSPNHSVMPPFPQIGGKEIDNLLKVGKMSSIHRKNEINIRSFKHFIKIQYIKFKEKCKIQNCKIILIKYETTFL